jgi:3-hydroxyisobutyrate dehydrogenase-like beta-hydroxyacid dehydrogenase
MQAKPNVGVIGVGAMGMQVAKRLLECGFPTFVRDIRPEAEDEARAAGAVVSSSPAELGRACRLVVTLVVDAEQTRDVIVGRHGVIETLAPGGAVIMSSTIQPDAAQALAEPLAARRVHFLDAPCSGGPAKARAGSMSMMLAGADAAFDRAAVVLEAISGTRVRISDRPGDGSKAKIVNNMLAGVNLAAACEAMALAIKLQLDPQTMVEVIGASSGGSWMFSDRMPRVLAGDYAPRAAIDILRKDLAILLETARNERFPALVARAAHALYEDASRLGHGHEDDAALMKVYQTLTGIALPGDA